MKAGSKCETLTSHGQGIISLSFIVFGVICLMFLSVANRFRRSVKNRVFTCNNAGMEVFLCVCGLLCTMAWAFTNAYRNVASRYEVATIGDIQPVLVTLSGSFSLLCVANLAFAWLDLNQQASSMSRQKSRTLRIVLSISVAIYVAITLVLSFFRKYSIVGFVGLIYFTAFNLMYYFVGKRFARCLGKLCTSGRATRAMKRAKRVILQVQINFILYIPCLATATVLLNQGGINSMLLLWVYTLSIDMIILCLANFAYIGGLYGSLVFEDRIRSTTSRKGTGLSISATTWKKSRVGGTSLIS